MLFVFDMCIVLACDKLSRFHYSITVFVSTIDSLS